MATVNAVKERPILFSGPMVRAILDGRKTQTRRQMKTGPDSFESPTSIISACPYGKPGDRLWIKTSYKTRFSAERFETFWTIDGFFFTTHGRAYSKSERKKKDGQHSAMFMPRWLSDSLHLPLLEIVSVRIERLQDISEADAKAEGAKESIVLPGDRGSFVPAFANLWCEINGVQSWASNPWVWVIEFEIT